MDVQVQFPNEEGRKGQNADVDHGVRYARSNVHGGVVCRWGALHPIAANGPDLKECGKEKGDQPGSGNDQQNFDGDRPTIGREEPPV